MLPLESEQLRAQDPLARPLIFDSVGDQTATDRRVWVHPLHSPITHFMGGPP